MIKCEVINMFSLSRFDELKNIQRKIYNDKGQLYKGDVFECSVELAKYLEHNNVINILEVIPDMK